MYYESRGVPRDHDSLPGHEPRPRKQRNRTATRREGTPAPSSSIIGWVLVGSFVREQHPPPPPSEWGPRRREGGREGARGPPSFPWPAGTAWKPVSLPPPPSPRLTVFLAQPGMAHRREGGVCVWPEGKLRNAHGPPGDDGWMGTGLGGYVHGEAWRSFLQKVQDLLPPLPFWWGWDRP